MTDKISDIKTDVTLPDLAKADVVKAKKEGALDAIRDSAARQFAQTDGNPVVEDPNPGIQQTNDATHLEYLLEMDPKALKAALQGKDDQGLTLKQGTIASLLEMERSGHNRTDVVEALCDVLNIKSPYEVTDAGPAYTNDVSRSVLKPRG
ncbi:hypothetical protein FPZ24_08190 [Sphingomonas panacisoli]|uniref:Uncharacterized protein n=1 Tax=Sphingomonas panacisoli TaxID=1813879 RepID=A0A5B8LIN2_9SPHN|nr:hypothetical protein [Sphingomonas panacisoli]QDZ07462.1 hypothetical protein FPZ24_08190 [Sphingomonas panacisoli]